MAGYAGRCGNCVYADKREAENWACDCLIRSCGSITDDECPANVGPNDVAKELLQWEIR